MAASRGAITFAWIKDRRTDLAWYIGSAGAGWLYVGIIFLLGRNLADPLHDALVTVRLGGLELPISLTVIVVWSFAYLVDGPHIWATLGRTLMDPDEWDARRRDLLKSFGWFLLGPAVIFAPFVGVRIAAAFGAHVPRSTLWLGYHIFYTFFRLWAYYHVVRQHWGFFRLYKRKAGDFDERYEGLETWFFNASLYLPLLLFFTAPFYEATPGTYPNLGLHTAFLGGHTLSEFLHPAFWGVYFGFLGVYAVVTLRRYFAGEAVNGSKLLFLASILPLHLAVFCSPLLAAFLIPLITVGHDLQYHRIVWDYGRDKYFGGRGQAVKAKTYKWTRRAFGSVAAYAAFGLVFTFLFFRGPWIEWLGGALGSRLDQALLVPVGQGAGLAPWNIPLLGEVMLSAFFLGWSMQHYYLDAKIWRVSTDEALREHLKLEEPGV